MKRLSLQKFLRGQSGAMTAFGLFMSLSGIVIGGLAIDVANAIKSRTELQVAADVTAHAALYVRDMEDEITAVQAALDIAQVNLPSEIYGSVLTADDIRFGYWDRENQIFTPDHGSKDAVMVDISRLVEKGNGVGTYFLNFVGLTNWDVRRAAVFETYIPVCFREGFVAEDVVDVQSNNAYLNGFCIHSNDHVEVNSNNFFENNTVVSMPDKQDIVLPNSGFETNDGLQSALRDGSYQIRILNRLQDIIDDLSVAGPDYTPDYISGTGVVNLAGKNLDASDFVSGRVHKASCSGGQSLKLASGTVLTDVVLVTNCKVQFGQGTTLDNTIVATTNTSAKSMTAPSSLQIGRDDSCAPDGGSQLLSMGGMEFPADLKVFGGQLIAQQDIAFAANANGIEGASFISGGTISGTSNMTMGFCGSGMERNFEAEYFRLAI